MNNLIKNEFKKLFSRKVIYVLLIIALAFTILNNVMYNLDSSYDMRESIKDELSYLENLNNFEIQTEEYIDLKTRYDFLSLLLNYETDSWQFNFINNNYYSTIYDLLRVINQNTYGINKDMDILAKSKLEYEAIIKNLNSGSWEFFLEQDLKNINEEIKYSEDYIKTLQDKNLIKEANMALEYSKIDKQAIEWRLEKKIPYDNSFLSNKIEEYVQSAQTVYEYKLENLENKSESEAYTSALKTMNISKYYIENNINMEKEINGRYILMNLPSSEYGTFIVIFSIIIAGAIVSNEFQKGTIKLLLTKPYSRNKILLSKYIVSICIMFLFIIVFSVLQYIIGGIVFGFDIFSIPAVEYDLSSNSLVVIPIIQYLIYMIIAMLPVFILLSTLAFALSTICMNSVISIALPILGFTVSEVINLFAPRFKLLKYFVTANWDLSVYLFGGSGIAEGLTLSKSIIICLIYFTIMMLTTFTIFKKRDIKNV